MEGMKKWGLANSYFLWSGLWTKQCSTCSGRLLSLVLQIMFISKFFTFRFVALYAEYSLGGQDEAVKAMLEFDPDIGILSLLSFHLEDYFCLELTFYSFLKQKKFLVFHLSIAYCYKVANTLSILMNQLKGVKKLANSNQMWT